MSVVWEWTWNPTPPKNPKVLRALFTSVNKAIQCNDLHVAKRKGKYVVDFESSGTIQFRRIEVLSNLFNSRWRCSRKKMPLWWHDEKGNLANCLVPSSNFLFTFYCAAYHDFIDLTFEFPEIYFSVPTAFATDHCVSPTISESTSAGATLHNNHIQLWPKRNVPAIAQAVMAWHHNQPLQCGHRNRKFKGVCQWGGGTNS